MYQEPRVVAEDLAKCYPAEYYTKQLPDVPPAASAHLWKETVRRLVLMAGMKDTPPLKRVVGAALARSRFIRERAFRLLDELIPWRPGAHALDVGCGSGEMLVRLQRAGWNVEGLENDPTAAELARRISGAVVHETRFQGVRSCGYHLVLAHHVFEHLEDPGSFLSWAKSVIASDGRIVIVYPNPNSFAAWWCGRTWYAWDAPRHLALATLPGMSSLARRTGLNIVRARRLTRASRASFEQWRPGAPEVLIRLLCGLDQVLSALGLPVGEELVITLAVSNAGSP